MASEIRIKDSVGTGTITISPQSLANGSATQGAFLANTNDYPAALIFPQLTSGQTAPTVGTVCTLYLLRYDGWSIADDGAATAGTAAITIVNSPELGTQRVTASASTTFKGPCLDTWALGPLGPHWTVAVGNDTGQSLNVNAGSHVLTYVYYVPENQ